MAIRWRSTRMSCTICTAVLSAIYHARRLFHVNRTILAPSINCLAQSSMPSWFRRLRAITQSCSPRIARTSSLGATRPDTSSYTVSKCGTASAPGVNRHVNPKSASDLHPSMAEQCFIVATSVDIDLISYRASLLSLLRRRICQLAILLATSQKLLQIH